MGLLGILSSLLSDVLGIVGALVNGLVGFISPLVAEISLALKVVVS